MTTPPIPMLLWNVVDELTYSNYAHNRLQSPQISLDRMARVYGMDKVRLMEQRFQREHPEMEPEPLSAAEVMAGELPIGVESTNPGAGPTFAEVMAVDDECGACHQTPCICD